MLTAITEIEPARRSTRDGWGSAVLDVRQSASDPIAGLAVASIAARRLAGGRAAQVDVPLAAAAAWVAATASGHIDRPVVCDGSDWFVELADGPVLVSPPAVPASLLAAPE